MKAKTLLIAAATLAVGAITSQAQVYSQNVVGYINLTLTNGYNLVANQLDFDGTKTNNNVVTVFGTNLPASTLVEAWKPSTVGFTSASWINSKGVLKWTGDTNGVNAALQTGQGVFISTPSPTTITLIGQVVQGTNVNVLTPGYNLVSSIPPIAGDVVTNLTYSPLVGDLLEIWSPASQGFVGYSYINSKGVNKWSPTLPAIPVGSAVFLKTLNTAWTNTLNIQ
jgi:hypothetical protein